MNSANKFWTLAFIVLVLSGLFVFSVNSVNVCAVGKQPVPQFTVKFVDYSYNVAPTSTTSVDPYTGKETITTIPGYHVEHTRIEVVIKKQSFKPYTDERGYTYDLYYGVQFKGHFSDYWVPFGGAKNQPNSDIVAVGAEPIYTSMYVAGSKLDFRVSAGIVGYREDSIYANYVDESRSDWSKVQTITIPNGSSSQPITLPPYVTSDDGDGGQLQPPDQTQPLKVLFTNPLFTLVVGVLFGGVVVAVVMMILKRHLKTSNKTDPFLIVFM
ncbi:MAG: hypothetical protein FWD52_05550 [Candidatus Bathyarchaeota archaeon]|nr:hypothetical protein [Candidatus Termiticorpusculum sp.]